MIERFSCIPKLLRVTRRGFGALIGGAALGSLVKPAAASNPPWSFVVVPDPQYIPGHCPGVYSALMQWIVDNTTEWKIKFVLGVGDCMNTTGSGERAIATTAFGILDNNKIPWITPPGNHDYTNGGTSVVRSALDASFVSGGFFAADTRSAKSYWGSALAAGGGSCSWGGTLDASSDGRNTWFRMVVGTRRLIIFSLDFHPASTVMEAAKTLAATYSDHEVIVTTHSYMTDMGNLVYRDTAISGAGVGASSDPYWKAYGPDNYVQGAAPASNSGYEQWNGASGQVGYKAWANPPRIILCGHWLYQPYHATGPATPWYWQRQAATANSGVVAQQIFANAQDLDNVSAYCGSGPGDGVADVAHLFLINFPNDTTVEGYMLSVNTGKWYGAAGVTGQASPVTLFSQPYSSPLGGGQFPLASPVVGHIGAGKKDISRGK